MTINRQAADRAFMAGRRNLVINGDFRVWQRGESFAANGYTADRWNVQASGTNLSVTRAGLGITATQDAGSGWVNFRQGIEWEDWFYGQTFTLSFKAVCPDGISVQIEVRDGSATGAATFADVIRTDDSFVLPVSANRYEVTFTVPASATGTPSMIMFYIGGNKGSPTAGNTAHLELGEVQLEAGEVATPFEHRPIAEEVALCQRYYTASRIEQPSTVYSAGYFQVGPVNFPVSMRMPPTIALAVVSIQGASGVTELMDRVRRTELALFPIIKTNPVAVDGAGLRVEMTYTADAEL